MRRGHCAGVQLSISILQRTVVRTVETPNEHLGARVHVLALSVKSNLSQSLTRARDEI